MGFWVFFTDDKAVYYDSDACELYLSPDRRVAIVANSKIIFDSLIENRNAVISRDQILSWIYGIEVPRSLNNKLADRTPVDEAITVLRKKLNKYRDCIQTVWGHGYKYVGPPKVNKGDQADLSFSCPSWPMSSRNSSHAPDHDAPVSAPQITLNKPGGISSETRSRRVVENLERSLKLLVEASDTSQIRYARLLIKRAIKSYVDEISLNYSNKIDEDGTSWTIESLHHERWLRKAITYCRAEVESIDQGTDLFDIKMQLIDYIYDWHIFIELLGAQLSLELEALELSGNLIGKEAVQARIDKIDREYRFAFAFTSMADASIDEKLDEFDRGRDPDKPKK